MKRPFEAVLELFASNLQRAAESDKRNIEFLHSFTIWILGFSIGALSLIASNFVNLKVAFSYWTLKSVIICLSISIVSGVLHRIYLFAYQALYDSNMFYVEGALSNAPFMENNPVDVSNEGNAETLVNLLKSDFDIDETETLRLYNTPTVEGKSYLIHLLRKKYTDIGEWAKKDYELAFNHVNSVLSNAFGLTESEIKKSSEVSGLKIRRLRKIFVSMLYLSGLTFILAILIFAIAY